MVGYTVSVDLGGNATTAELTLNDDGTANLKVFTDIPCTYEKIGSAVVLTPVGELEGYAAQIWAGVGGPNWTVEGNTATKAG